MTNQLTRLDELSGMKCGSNVQNVGIEPKPMKYLQRNLWFVVSVAEIVKDVELN